MAAKTYFDFVGQKMRGKAQGNLSSYPSGFFVFCFLEVPCRAVLVMNLGGRLLRHSYDLSFIYCVLF